MTVKRKENYRQGQKVPFFFVFKLQGYITPFFDLSMKPDTGRKVKRNNNKTSLSASLSDSYTSNTDIDLYTVI